MVDGQEIARDAVENPGARRAVIPSTGETFELTGPDAELHAALVAVDGYLREVQAARAEIAEEIVARMDREAKWTVAAAGGVKLSAPSPAAGEKLDAEALAESMKTLVEDGVIEMGAFDRAFTREVKATMPDRAYVSLLPWLQDGEERGVKASAGWKVGKAGLSAIVKVAGPRGAALVEAATLPGDTPRRLTVKAAG